MPAHTTPTPNLGLDVPSLFDLDPETKDTLIGSIKRVLQRLQKAGKIDPELRYGDLLKSPDHLMHAIAAYRDNRELAGNIALDREGNAVINDRTPLVCGITTAQVERMLVYTCAKKTLAPDWGENLPEEVRAYVVFPWQLPLLEAYRLMLTPQHVRALADGLLLLRSVTGIRAAAGAAPDAIVKTRHRVGDRYGELLETNPRALAGIPLANDEAFQRIDAVAGRRIWDVFGADPQMIAELTGLNMTRLRALGPDMADLCLPALQLLEEVPEWMMASFMRSLRTHLGSKTTLVLGDEEFAGQMLRDIVGQFRSMKDLPEYKRQNLEEIIDLKWAALAAKIESWLAGVAVTGAP